MLANPSAPYRPEVDGLRAIAVLSVLFFHAEVKALSGGFIGVDVFFVLSGFLISRLILADIDRGKFSLIGFYERRIRRIFPCLYAVLLVSSVAAAALLLPRDFARFFEDLTWVVLFGSNIRFWLTSGYFEPSTTYNPLVHTWSLAVEEQFYLIFPLLLLLVTRRLRRHLPIVLFLFALGSLFYSWWLTPDRFAFYMTPTRAFELLAGALIAVEAVPRVRGRMAREITASAGLLTILFTAFWFTRETPFPGLAALIPVAGAVAVIAYAPGTVAGRLLSWPPAVFVGLISYSLYMWHWPLLVFARYSIGDLSGSAVETALFCAISLLVAALSWRYIEQPFRNSDFIGRTAVLAGGACTMLAGLLVSLGGVAMDGWPSRLPQVALEMERASGDFSPRRADCHDVPHRRVGLSKACVYGASVEPEVVIWGDSFAVELAYALGEKAAERNSALLHFSSSACPPTLGFALPGRQDCLERNVEVLSYVLEHERLRTLILVANFEHYPDHQPVIEGLRKTVNALVQDGRRVILVAPIPTPPWPVPWRLAALALENRVHDAHISARKYHENNADLLAAFNDLKSPRVSVFQPEEVFCRGERCEVYRDGRPLYFDDVHLSVAGARLLAASLVGELKPAAR